MQRAAVLIGVGKTGSLQPLQATTTGVRAMERWALNQGIDRRLVKVITDEAGRVTAQHVKDAIEEIVELTTVEQLIVYFAGHGVNIGYGERWLLSRAPEDTQAAVNVEGSVVLARHCGISHVVLISDACRTAAEGIQAQLVTGSEVFPNTGSGGLEHPVDLFFACTLGAPALEMKDPAVSAGRYQAIFTDALVEALEGNHELVVERDTTNGRTIGLIRPSPLKPHLQADVLRRLTSANVKPSITQTPDARITSDGNAWLSQVQLRRRVRARGRLRRGGAPSQNLPMSPPGTLLSLSQTMLRSALSGGQHVDYAGDLDSEGSPVAGIDLLTRSLAQDKTSFGPEHFETGCGFKVRGARITGAFSPAAQTELLGNSGELLRVSELMPPAANVVISFDNETGVILPAIPEFLVALTFSEGELTSVAYEPSDRSWRWSEFRTKLGEIRALRALISSSARLGVFRLESEDALKLARRMQYAKTLDPAMALYSAYAYHDLQLRDRIKEMLQYQFNDLGLRLFDIALLTRMLDSQTVGAVGGVFPFLPLLSQGWALLAAHQVAFTPALVGIERHLVPSLWTLYDLAGVDMILAAIRARDVR